MQFNPFPDLSSSVALFWEMSGFAKFIFMFLDVIGIFFFIHIKLLMDKLILKAIYCLAAKWIKT